MGFVSIATLLNELAAGQGYKPSEDETERYSAEHWAEAEVFSRVASDLYQSLHNANDAESFRWMEIKPPIDKPLHSPDSAIEGMDILKHAAGWLSRLREEHSRYLADMESAENAGINPETIRPAINPNGGLYTLKGLVRRSHEIGFERSEVIAGTGKTEQQQPSLSWIIRRPRREQGYTPALIRALEHFHNRGNLQRPKAREVLDYWRNQEVLEPELFELLRDGISFHDAKGDIKKADLNAIHKVIKRVTEVKTPA